MSCVKIMLEYFKADKFSSFGFVAAHDIVPKSEPGIPNKRFRFYRRMMLSMFGSETFVQGYDTNNSIYLLINKSMLQQGEISIPLIETAISRLYEGDYSLMLES